MTQIADLQSLIGLNLIVQLEKNETVEGILLDVFYNPGGSAVLLKLEKAGGSEVLLPWGSVQSIEENT